MEQKLHELVSEMPENHLTFEDLAQAERLPKGKLPAMPFRRALAACVALVLCLSLGVFAYRAEAMEYRDALAFFQANGLSTEGLTRYEIKAVYRDIFTKSFTFSKTGQVIQNSLTQEQIEGFEILQPEPTPEDVENLWNYKHYCDWFVPLVYPDYVIRGYHKNDSSGHIVEIEYYAERHENGNKIWSVQVPSYDGEFYPVSDGVIVCGYDSSQNQNGTIEADGWMIKIDHGGNLLWTQKLENGFDREYPEGVLENADGSYTLFSRGNNKYLCVSQYSDDGERILYKQTYMEQFYIRKVAHYDGGYLLHVGTTSDSVEVRFIRVDRQGNVLGDFSYYDGEYVYRIQDMVEHGGKVYVSAYTVPRPETFPEIMGKPFFALWNEVDEVIEKVYDDGSEDDLVPLLRANYRAVLLVCDPKNGGKLETFYMINGSLGGNLHLTDEGNLIWETESISDAYYSPGTSAFSILGQCCVYQYFFNAEGNLYTMGKTDRVTGFYR